MQFIYSIGYQRIFILLTPKAAKGGNKESPLCGCHASGNKLYYHFSIFLHNQVGLVFSINYLCSDYVFY